MDNCKQDTAFTNIMCKLKTVCKVNMDYLLSSYNTVMCTSEKFIKLHWLITHGLPKEKFWWITGHINNSFWQLWNEPGD